MKNTFISLLLVLIGVILGIYVGGYLMLYLGLIDLISYTKNWDAATSKQIAWAIIRIFPLAEISAYICFIVPTFLGYMFFRKI